MGKSKISYCDEVCNPFIGCKPASEGCRDCWAKRTIERFDGTGTFEGLRVFEGRVDEFSKRGLMKEPTVVFWQSMTDLFQRRIREPMSGEIERVLRKILCAGYMNEDPRLWSLFLTKRPRAMKEVLQMFRKTWGVGLKVGHTGVGVTVESPRYIPRIEYLRHIVASFKWVSAEPLLRPYDVVNIRNVEWGECVDWIVWGCEQNGLGKWSPWEVYDPHPKQFRDHLKRLVEQFRNYHPKIRHYIKQVPDDAWRVVSDESGLKAWMGMEVVREWPEEMERWRKEWTS